MSEANGYKLAYEAGKEDLVLARKRKVPDGVRVKTGLAKMHRFEDWLARNTGNN